MIDIDEIDQYQLGLEICETAEFFERIGFLFGLLLILVHRTAMRELTRLYVQHMQPDFKQLMSTQNSSHNETFGISTAISP